MFYLPLERLENSLGVWYSRVPQNSFGSGLKVQKWSRQFDLSRTDTFSKFL
jgi:hypothetical protein